MPAPITTSLVWAEIERQQFGVVGMVTAKGEARTAGVVYLVRDRKVYFSTETEAWKTRHLARNPSVSMTVPIPRGIPLMPWIKVPPATITFSGTAAVLPLGEVPAEIPDALLHDLEPRDELRARSSVVEITPQGQFVTYGVGVSVKAMLSPADAAGRTSVA